MADYSRMKVVELKAELKRLGLPQNGLKAELISRLEEAAAAASEDSPTETAQPPAEATTTTEPNEAQPSEVVEPASASPEPSRAETTQELQVAPAPDIDIDMAQDSSRNDAQAQVTSHTTTSETPSLPIADVVQDVQKRKRRSTTPPPSDEVARKRLRQDDADVTRDATLDVASDKHEPPKSDNEDTDQVSMTDIDTKATHDEEWTDKVPELDGKEDGSSGGPANGAEEKENTRGATTKTSGDPSEDAEDSVMPDAGATSPQRGTRSATDDNMGQETHDPEHSPSPELDIEPSIHPATCALYIKNFMRPLRPQAVQDHLLGLATPANAPLDGSIIANFYLDNIRTHAFAVFTSVSAASRVRTALHKRVWPDETNRKALWIDFIPPDCFEDWIDLEQQARNTGNMPRYEVVYDNDNDGNVFAKLEETDANQAARRGPASPVTHPDRKNSIPTGPSRPFGIENAPTGPRNPYSHNGPASMYPTRQETIDPGFIKTKSGPPVLYRPVAPELAQRRLGILAQAKDPNYSYEESGKDYHRYYFERDEVLVNRGPEIFLGIRPPHREKERREIARTGGGDPRDRFRDRRGPPGPPGAGGGGGGGGGGRRRRRAPRPHGVPRGGDRFRPGPSYDDRAALDDRHPPRREAYGRGSNRRKDNHRY
ncbi:hypothetical protein F4782DRAFT_489251 [Xylaria castorea]|nr:hypothetical protein F4782DRAFT_489251 [Xylaria castorea]